MNVEIANSLYGYFEALYFLNQKLIKLCGLDAIDYFKCDLEEPDINDIELISKEKASKH